MKEMVEEVGLDLHRERDSRESNLALRILISFILVWFLNHLTWVDPLMFTRARFVSSERAWLLSRCALGLLFQLYSVHLISLAV